MCHVIARHVWHCPSTEPLIKCLLRTKREREREGEREGERERERERGRERGGREYLCKRLQIRGKQQYVGSRRKHSMMKVDVQGVNKVKVHICQFIFWLDEDAATITPSR